MSRSIKPSMTNLPKVVSLFCGAGGLDWGFDREGFDIALAIDISNAAIKTYQKNFPTGEALAADLGKLGPDGVSKYVSERIARNEQIGVIGGPPCQGFSRANTRASAMDPRNKLPLLYLNIIKKLQEDYSVEFVILENVLGIRDKKHVETFNSITEGLKTLGFVVHEKELCALEFGVPQNRRRVVLFAMRADGTETKISIRKRRGKTTVCEAIRGLVPPAFYSSNLKPHEIPLHPNHWTMKPRSMKFSTPQLMRTNSRSFKRLSWEDPSPTIAFGNREIHVHPDGHRRLSIYEAMLLQGFPPDFVLEGNLSQQVEQVSNAVPPPLARGIASAVRRALLADCKVTIKQ